MTRTALQPRWLCDDGDHTGCNGYACECCAAGHLTLHPSGVVLRRGTTPDPGVQLELLALAAPPRAITERDLYAASGLIFETQHCADGDHLICTGIVDVTDGGTVGQLTPTTKHHGPCRCECHA